MNHNAKDVVVIGGGVVGTAILKALSAYDLDIVLIEKQPDVCEGTSKANSGIVHTGFDAKPGSVEAEALRRSRELWPQAVENLKIPFLPCGAVMVAISEQEKQTIQNKYIPNAKANGVEVEWISKEDLQTDNPAVTNEALGGLVIPGEAVVDPFWATRAFAELATLNGAEVLLGSGVEAIEEIEDDNLFRVVLENHREVYTHYIINAAGLWSDEIARMVGDDSFEITPRKGQFILTEEPIDISQIMLPVPTEKSKGTLVAPVVFGGFLLGPTAEDQEDKWDRSTTDSGLSYVKEKCDKLIPGVSELDSIRQFAGVRAVSSVGDFIIRQSEAAPRMIHAAGIRSTGISASLGIAEMVVEVLEKTDLPLEAKANVETELPELFDSEEEGAGEIVCLCRSITKSEIVNALNRPLTPHTVDGVKRRTGAVLGECQGNCCIPKIIDLIREHSSQAKEEPILKGLQESYVAAQGVKNHVL